MRSVAKPLVHVDGRWLRPRVLAAASLVAACNLSQANWYVSRPIERERLSGAWRLVDPSDRLEMLTESQGLAPLHLGNGEIRLNLDGSCYVPLEVTDPAPIARRRDDGIVVAAAEGLVHPVESCRWSVTAPSVRQGYRTQSVAAVDIAITSRGYLRGLRFFMRELGGEVRLWARPNSSKRIELVLLRNR
jgi:hypothetical protein